MAARRFWDELFEWDGYDSLPQHDYEYITPEEWAYMMPEDRKYSFLFHQLINN